MPTPDSPDRIRALLALYRATHYDVTLPEHRVATLRIGAPLPAALQHWMGSAPCAGFITACNPHSQILSQPENERRLAALRERLRLQPCRFLEGVGHIPGKRWREPSLFVAGLDLAVLDALAGPFAQNAVVIVPAQGTAHLRIHRTEWRAIVGTAPDLDWVRD